MMKLGSILTIMTLTVLFLSAPLKAEPRARSAVLPIKPIAQSNKIKNLCGPTAASMITAFYGHPELDQYKIGKGVCKMVARYARKHPKANPLPCSWPDNYRETYQPILAIYLNKHGFKTQSTRTSYSEVSGKVKSKRVKEFMKIIREGTPIIIHVEGHYLLIIGYDDDRKILTYNDSSGGKQSEIAYSSFFNRHERWYKGRLGWDGRYLAVWKKE